MKSRMRSQRRDSSGPPPSKFRLRHVLSVLVLGWGGLRLAREAKAAFELHTAATLHANYVLCMAGPTGPELLRNRSADYAELLRRRVVSAAPEQRPFAACATLAEKVGLPRALHEVQAGTFGEYVDEAAPSPSVLELDFDRSRLESLAARAGFFAPSELGELIVPERHAEEAPHPRAPERPALGSGLPRNVGLYRSTIPFGDSWVLEHGSGANAERLVSHDRGLNWRRVSGSSEPGPSGPCAASPDGAGFSLIMSEANETVLVSRTEKGASRMTKLAGRHEHMRFGDCDGLGFLALLVHTQTSAPSLKACTAEGPCTDVPFPRFGSRGLDGDIDVAWIAGDIVLALRHGRLTRVTTSRDFGQSWTPWVLAFDGRGWLEPGSEGAPRRLLHVGEDLLLYGAPGRASSPYFALLSRDHGASFSSDFNGAPLEPADRLVNRE